MQNEERLVQEVPDRKAEEELIRRTQNRDSAAFAQLYESYFDKIYRYIAVRIQQQANIEDMTQQVFIKALQSICSYKCKGVPFSSWLFRIAHNHVIDYYRKENKRTTVPIDDIQITADGEDSPEDLLEQKIDIEQLKVATRRLTQYQQEVISLRFASELSIAEVAETMGKSEGAIKALQHSAVAALRKALLVKEP